MVSSFVCQTFAVSAEAVELGQQFPEAVAAAEPVLPGTVTSLTDFGAFKDTAHSPIVFL